MDHTINPRDELPPLLLLPREVLGRGRPPSGGVEQHHTDGAKELEDEGGAGEGCIGVIERRARRIEQRSRLAEAIGRAVEPLPESGRDAPDEVLQHGLHRRVEPQRDERTGQALRA